MKRISLNIDKKKIIKFIIALSLLSSLIIAHFPQEATARNVMRFVAKSAAFGSIILLIWQQLLGLRSLSRFLDPDTIWLQNIHKKLGRYGVVLFFIHPILISIYKHMDIISYSLWPSFKDPYETAITYGRLAFWVVPIIWLSSIVLKKKISFKIWKNLHLLSYLILPLSVAHTVIVSATIESSHQSILWKNVLIYGTLALILSKLLHLMGFWDTKATVQENKTIDEEQNLVLIKFSEPLKIGLGQFGYIRHTPLQDGHPYNFVKQESKTNENDDRLYYLLVKRVGKFSNSLADVKVGDKLIIDAPYGQIAGDSEQPSVFTKAIIEAIGKQ